MKTFLYFICALCCLSFVIQKVNHKSSDLKINSLKYIKLNSTFHDRFLFNNISIEDTIKRKIHLFTKQVKDIGNNEVFIQAFNCGNGVCLTPISPGNEPHYELLLAINKSTRNANCIIIGYHFLGDSETYSMNYSFLNDSTLKLQEIAEIGGEEDSLGNIEVEEAIGKSHLITILKSGEIRNY